MKRFSKFTFNFTPYIFSIIEKGKWIIRNPHQFYNASSPLRRKAILAILFLFISWLLFLITDLIFPLPEPKTYSQVIYDKDGVLLCAYLTDDDKWRLKADLNQINKDLISSLIYKEDSWFYWHFGVNPFSMGRAIAKNLTSGKRTSGASTITMQLARLSEPKSRTYLSKIKEILRAFQYEWHYSKREILEMYLSYLPYGGNIEGVHSASYLFFNRSPRQLSLSQSVMLAIIPNRPNSLRLDKIVEETIRFRNIWLKRMEKDRIFPQGALKAASLEPVTSARFEIKPQSPHLCNYLHEREKETELKTTLNLKYQKIAENLLANHTRRVASYGVSNGAILIVDNQSHNVIAYCGSANFYDNNTKGQVNGITAYRSPGSALKPVIYAMAFDKGLITPKMKLPDIPGNFSGYSPDNFDLQFRGLVTVRSALAHSLNLPPVWLVEELGFEPFAEKLIQCGFSDVEKRRSQFGYSLALGGCGATLEELTRFYSCFANGGKMYPLNYVKRQSEKKGNPPTLFSPATTYLIGDILSDLERPDLPQSYVNDSRVPKIAWKTGTSYGKRDAWAIGYSPRYTVGIWMGNMDGKGAPELSGAVMSVPLLLDIFNAIDYNANKKWFDRPEEVQERVVCAESGMLPSAEDCPNTVSDFYIKNISPLNTCNLYQELLISSDGKYQYCPVCCPAEDVIRKKYPVYKPEVALWLRTNQIGMNIPPPHFPQCPAKFSGEGPRILSPASKNEYYLEKGRGQQIALHAAADASVSNLHWYVNGAFIRTANKDEKIFITPATGWLRVTCVDDKGRRSETKVKVVEY